MRNKKEMKKEETVHTVGGFKKLTKQLIKDSVGKEDPEKILKWMAKLGENMKTMKINPFNPGGKLSGNEMQSPVKKHYGEK